MSSARSLGLNWPSSCSLRCSSASSSTGSGCMCSCARVRSRAARSAGRQLGSVRVTAWGGGGGRERCRGGGIVDNAQLPVSVLLLARFRH